MDLKELKETLCTSALIVKDILPTIYIPNEIFEDIRNYAKGSSALIASIYACYFLDTLLYRYAIYGLNEATLLVGTKKRVLGFPKDSRVIDPIIKKGGILNLMGYTKPESNFPISWNFYKGEFGDESELDFTYFKARDIDENGNDHGFVLPERVLKSISNRTKISYPIKAFYRKHTDRNGDESEWGTFYSIEHTHGIEVATFLKCMADKELGVEGFYIYALIKQMSNYFGGFWNVKLDRLIDLSGLRSTKFKEVLLTLRQYRMVTVRTMPWIINKPKNITTRTNGYKANMSSFFTSIKIELDKPIKTNWETCQRKYSYAIIDPEF